MRRPVYAQEIIVIIKFNSVFEWYMSDKELWVMNYYQWLGSVYLEALPKSIRSGFPVLDTDNWSVFRNSIQQFAVSTNELRKLIAVSVPLSSWDDDCELFPSVYINFDEKVLKSVFSESLLFENYLPVQWKGTYENFFDSIPLSAQYWIVDNQNHLDNLL